MVVGLGGGGAVIGIQPSPRNLTNHSKQERSNSKIEHLTFSKIKVKLFPQFFFLVVFLIFFYFENNYAASFRIFNHVFTEKLNKLLENRYVAHGEKLYMFKYFTRKNS